MKTTWIVMASVPFLFDPAATGPLDHESATRPAQGLVRVQPDTQPNERFDREGWHAKLVQSDLDARERAFERLIELARTKRAAREALEGWARDQSQPELAWTARLALRSLGEAALGDEFLGMERWNDLNSRFDQLRRRFDNFDPMFDDMQRDLDRLYQHSPFKFPGAQPGTPAGSSAHQSFSLQITPDGVTCEITEDVDGEKKTRTFKADSLEELLEAHPELRERVHGGASPRAWNRIGPRDGAIEAPAARAPRMLRRAPGAPPPTDMLGIEWSKLPAEQVQSMGLEPELGLSVEGTLPGTIAEILGIQRGDFLIELNGTPLYGPDDVGGVLRKRDAEAELVVVLIDKKGQRRTLTWKPSTKE